MVQCLGEFAALIEYGNLVHIWWLTTTYLYVTPALWNLTPSWRPLQAPTWTCTYTHTHTHKSLGAEEMAKQLKAHTVALGEHWNSATSTHIKWFPTACNSAPMDTCTRHAQSSKAETYTILKNVYIQSKPVLLPHS